jgi:hypothetical protein
MTYIPPASNEVDFILEAFTPPASSTVDFELIADVVAGKIKIWTGAEWILKPYKTWTGASFEVKPTKLWDGSVWITL